MPKSEYCIQARRDSGVACAGCYDKVSVDGLNPVNKKLLDVEIGKLEKAGRVKRCNLCNHQIIVCKSCTDYDYSYYSQKNGWRRIGSCS